MDTSFDHPGEQPLNPSEFEQESEKAAPGVELAGAFGNLKEGETDEFMDMMAEKIAASHPEEFAKRMKDQKKTEAQLASDFRIQLRPTLRTFMRSRGLMKPEEAMRQLMDIGTEKLLGAKAAAQAIERQIAGETLEGGETAAELKNDFDGFVAGALSQEAFYDRLWDRLKQDHPSEIQTRLEQLKGLGTSESVLKDDLVRQTRGLLNNLKVAVSKDPGSADKAFASFYAAAEDTATASGKRRKAA